MYEYKIFACCVNIYLMKIISIDVGIKNLALCLFSLDVINNTAACEEDNESGLKVDKKITILKWDVVNLTQKDDVTYGFTERLFQNECRTIDTVVSVSLCSFCLFLVRMIQIVY